MKAALASLQRLIKMRLNPRVNWHDILLTDFPEDYLKIIKKVRPYTMTSPHRLNALIDATHYLETNQISGCIVECGVWRGGSMMAVAYTLKNLNSTKRNLYLFDTFQGMPEPQKLDTSQFDASPLKIYNQHKRNNGGSNWCYSPLEETRKNMTQTGYPTEKIHYIPGKVEDTLPQYCPEEPIALLRLDTDFYSSTRQELTYLYPKLVRGGVFILDDYGHWEGQRLAMEEYLKENQIPFLLNRVDYTGRIGIKP